MADVEPELQSLRAAIDARDKRIAELETTLKFTIDRIETDCPQVGKCGGHFCMSADEINEVRHLLDAAKALLSNPKR